MKKSAEKTEMAATKVTAESLGLLRRIARKIGLDVYGLLQNMVSSLIKYADTWHQLDPKLSEAIRIYDNFQGWDKLTSIAGVGDRECVQAIYFIVEPGKKGQFAVMCKPAFFDTDNVTYNGQEILKATLQAVSPSACKRLEYISRQLDTNSYLETILYLIEEKDEDPDAEYIRQLFADCNRSEYGRPVDIKKYEPHRNKKLSNYEQRSVVQETNLFAEVESTVDEDKD